MFTKNYSYGYYNTIFPNCISHLKRKQNFFPARMQTARDGHTPIAAGGGREGVI